MIATLGTGNTNASAALVSGPDHLRVCGQDRATRVRRAGVGGSGLPDDALDLLLERAGRSRADITRYVVTEGDGTPPDASLERVTDHFAHACTAYLTSPSTNAVIVVCDHDAPEVSVWTGDGTVVRSVDWRWRGTGFARAYSRCAEALGFTVAAAAQAEALARLAPDARDEALERLLRLDADGLVIDPQLETIVADRIGAGRDTGAWATCAAALQARVGDLLLDVLRQVRAAVGRADLCLGGSLFRNSSFNTRVRQAMTFSSVFVPVDPGNAGRPVGAALQAIGDGPRLRSPFLGPSYSREETKQTLDNCKLHYSLESSDDAIMIAVDALRDGRLVGWFDGGMEWGPRALGARCILANPQARYVLDNLNQFLKRRAAWRGYSLSALEETVADHFVGPPSSPYMDNDYRPREPERLREVLPSPAAAVRVQSVARDGDLPQFRTLLEAFASVSGQPFLVNTSFNGWHEPIVCSPRDAVRVFYGTGLDVLVINQFVLRK